MFQVLSNGKEYRISVGGDYLDWATIGSANSIAEAYSKAKWDWDQYWGFCGLIPTRKLIVALAEG